MTDKHPMDDVPMPVCDTVSAAMSGRGVEYIDGYEIGFQCALDQLRAERIAAYELGRNAGLEEAANMCKSLQTGHGNRKFGSDVGDAARRSCAVHILSLKR